MKKVLLDAATVKLKSDLKNSPNPKENYDLEEYIFHLIDEASEKGNYYVKTSIELNTYITARLEELGYKVRLNIEEENSPYSSRVYFIRWDN